MGVEPDFEKKFNAYREHLEHEASRLASYIRIYRRLHERMADRLDELNIAPAFFQVALDALFSGIVIWIDKLFDEAGERGLFNFLTYVEYNCDALSLSELQRRRQYPDGHWMLRNRDSITIKTIEEHRKQIRDLEAPLKSFKLRRDKFHAHFDKDFFFDRMRLGEDAPITWGDLERLNALMWDILNTYSVAFDGNSYGGAPINADDVDRLLDALYRTRIRKDS